MHCSDDFIVEASGIYWLCPAESQKFGRSVLLIRVSCNRLRADV